MCRAVYQDLLPPHTQIRSFSSLGPVSYGAQSHTPVAAQKRSFSEYEAYQPMHRSIQPRPPRSTDSPIPPSTNGEGLTIVRTPMPESAQGTVRRKRGRPSKEEVEERDRALAAEGKVYEPKKRASKKSRVSTSTGDAAEGSAAPSSRAATPVRQLVEPKEESSSRKRRSKRQPDEEDPDRRSNLLTLNTETKAEAPSERTVQSPSDRLLHRHTEQLAVPQDVQSFSGSEVGRRPL